MRTLPLLDDLRVASPCTADWAAMSGDARQRFCGQCRQHVYDLTTMTEAAARALVFETEGKKCVRFYRRPDGTVLTADCKVGRQHWRRRAAIGAWAAVGACITVVGALLSGLGLGPDVTQAVRALWAGHAEPELMMGALPPPPVGAVPPSP